MKTRTDDEARRLRYMLAGVGDWKAPVLRSLTWWLMAAVSLILTAIALFGLFGFSSGTFIVYAVIGTAVVFACDKVEHLLNTDASLRYWLTALWAELTTPRPAKTTPTVTVVTSQQVAASVED